MRTAAEPQQTEVTWRQTDGQDQISISHRHHDRTTYTMIWGGASAPTYWISSPIDLDRRQILKEHIPEGVHDRLQASIHDLIARATLTFWMV